MNYKIALFELGELPTNTYVFLDEENGHAFLVDPAVYDEGVRQAMVDFGVKHLDYILLTHGHFDHILGVPGFLEAFPEAKVVIHRDEEAFLHDPMLSLSALHGDDQPDMQADVLVEDGDDVPFDGTVIHVLHTPGHTGGSVCYQVEDALFTGDTLFHLRCGRTDFPTSSPAAMRKSLRRLAAIEGNYQVLPGHEPTSTLDYEKEHNPVMRH